MQTLEVIEDINVTILNEIKSDIIGFTHNSKRSKQKALGASDIAAPCDRRMAYKMLGIEKSNFKDPWYMNIGTAVHAYLEQVYKAKNKDLGRTRYLLEYKVNFHTGLSGRLDWYDTETFTLRDWKIVGDSTLKEARLLPNEAYTDQLCQYAVGLEKKGLKVEWLEIVFLPRNNTLSKAVIQRFPFDIERAKAVLARHDRIKKVVKKEGVKALELLSTDSSGCFFCPFYLSGSPVLTEGCSGAQEIDATTTKPDKEIA